MLTCVNSINHEVKEWNEKNVRLTTCNQNTKSMIQGSSVPQTVDDMEVVFTYDVTFKVHSCEILTLIQMDIQPIYLLNGSTGLGFISNGPNTKV